MNSVEVQRRADDARTLCALGEALLAGSPTSSDLKAAGLQAVHSGIAASDAMSGHVFGYCAHSQDHRDAIRLLSDATAPDRRPAVDLGRLLDAKTTVDYSPEILPTRRASDLVRYARRLVDAMENLLRR